MSTNTEQLIDKIRKLRAKAEDPSITEAEAALYAAKVAELLQSHNLSESALNVEETKAEIRADRVQWTYMDHKWRRLICNAAAKLYFCHAYSTETGFGGNRSRDHVFVGKPHNIVVAKEMSEYLIKTTLRLAKDFATRHGLKVNGPQYWAFAKGCGLRITERLVDLHYQQTAAKPQRAANGNPGNLPALYEDEDKLVQAFCANLGLENLNRKMRTGDSIAFEAGRKAAENVSLSAQLSDGSRAKMLASK